MGKISKTEDNIYPIPTGASVTRGYVYLNMSSQRKANANGDSVPTHDKVAIGIVANDPGEDWKSKRLMYANSNFLNMLERIEAENNNVSNESADLPVSFKYITEAGIEKIKKALQDVPARGNNKYAPKLRNQKRDESLTIGVFLVVQQIASTTGLINILVAIFGEKIAMLLLDLALYAIDKHELVVQYMPEYAKDHTIFSEVAYSDGYISQLLLENVTLSKINLFKFLWVLQVLEENCQLFLCYDSTNVNSQCDSPEGVELVQKGHAKDKKDLKQVNLDYVIRQSDGLPVSFNTFPGAIPDISEAEEMFSFFDMVLETDVPEEYKYLFEGNGREEFIKRKKLLLKDLIFVCDRGYISEKNLNELDSKGFGYLLLLRGDTNLSKRLINKHFNRVKSSLYEIERGTYGDIVEEKLFDKDDISHFCHIIYDEHLRYPHETKLRGLIAGLEEEIKFHIKSGTKFTQNQLKKYREFFVLKTDWVFTEKRKKVNKSTKTVITGYRKDYRKIDHATKQCGFFVLISSKKIAVAEAIQIYRKRDIVEKTFLRLKSFLGMSCYRGHSAKSIQIRSLIWFLAAIIYSKLFSSTTELRANERNRKKYSGQAIIQALQHVKTIANLATMKYNKAYKLDKDIRLIFEAFGISENEVYEFAASIDLDLEMGSDD